MAPHWKCGSGQPVAGSNPALSAKSSADGSRMDGLADVGRAPVRACSLALTLPVDLAVKASLIDCRGRARRGTSGALNLQSAPAGLNSHPRTASLQAAA